VVGKICGSSITMDNLPLSTLKHQMGGNGHL